MTNEILPINILLYRVEDPISKDSDYVLDIQLNLVKSSTGELNSIHKIIVEKNLNKLANSFKECYASNNIGSISTLNSEIYVLNEFAPKPWNKVINTILLDKNPNSKKIYTRAVVPDVLNFYNRIK